MNCRFTYRAFPFEKLFAAESNKHEMNVQKGKKRKSSFIPPARLRKNGQGGEYPGTDFSKGDIFQSSPPFPPSPFFHRKTHTLLDLFRHYLFGGGELLEQAAGWGSKAKNEGAGKRHRKRQEEEQKLHSLKQKEGLQLPFQTGGTV